MHRRFSLILLTLSIIVALASIANASVTFTGTPAGSWAYSRLPAPQIGENDQYFPTSPSEYSGSQFQGYVSDAPWGNPLERAEFHIFTTYATSNATQQVALFLNGDDGHSLFVNDAFVGGGGFDVNIPYTLSLEAGVPVKLEVAGFNGPGDWVFVFGQSNGTSLSQTPGISLDATNVLPEPAGIVAAGLACLLVCRRSRDVVRVN
jgi:hypothetical protein